MDLKDGIGITALPMLQSTLRADDLMNTLVYDEPMLKPSVDWVKWFPQQSKAAKDDPSVLETRKRRGENHGTENLENTSNFVTARTKLIQDDLKSGKKARFVSPIAKDQLPVDEIQNEKEPMDERLKNIDPAMVETIKNEIMDSVTQVSWDDIAGLVHAKNTIKEVVVWPMLRPDIFTGLRGPPKGLLLFGPPGTGKTMIGKCIASQSKATFFNISSSSLTSKWVGEGEKMVRALFAVARVSQPSVIFVDEIDSLLTQRTEGEVEATRRIKTEFLVQFDGCGTNSDDRILMIGATNRPQEIDEAARRRFRKKLYIPLPEDAAREAIIRNLLLKQTHSLSDDEISDIVRRTDGYSGSDMDGLIREAALGPIRDIDMSDIGNIKVSDVRPISHKDFIDALTQVRASVSEKDLEFYLKFDQEFGSFKK